MLLYHKDGDFKAREKVDPLGSNPLYSGQGFWGVGEWGNGNLGKGKTLSRPTLIKRVEQPKFSIRLGECSDMALGPAIRKFEFFTYLHCYILPAKPETPPCTKYRMAGPRKPSKVGRCAPR